VREQRSSNRSLFALHEAEVAVVREGLIPQVEPQPTIPTTAPSARQLMAEEDI
jgi:hypothetical protein